MRGDKEFRNVTVGFLILLAIAWIVFGVSTGDWFVTVLPFLLGGGLVILLSVVFIGVVVFAYVSEWIGRKVFGIFEDKDDED